VRAVYTPNIAGLWSLSRTFVVDTIAPAAPVPTLPANNAIVTIAAPKLQWGAVTGAISYRVDVSTASDFSSFVVNGITVITNSYTISPALTNGDYYWRVRAVDTAGNISANSLSRKFTVALP